MMEGGKAEAKPFSIPNMPCVGPVKKAWYSHYSECHSLFFETASGEAFRAQTPIKRSK